MAVSGFVKTNTCGAIALADGTSPTPVSLTLAFDRGDLSLSNLAPVLNERVVIEARGKFKNLAYGARQYPTVSFSCWVSAFQDSGTAPGNILTFLQRTAGSAYASNDGTLGTGSKIPYTVDVTYTLEGTDWGDSADHTFTLHDVDFSIDSFTEASDGCNVSLTGTVYGEITGDLKMDEIA